LQFVATLKDDPKVQVVYYQVTFLGLHAKSVVLIWFCQSGIGTSTNNVLKTPASEAAIKLTDQMFAYSLDDHIKGFSFPPRVPSFPHD
jgi:uncharacterized protein (DUF2235 family)